MSFGTDFLNSALARFGEQKSLGDRTFAQLTGSQMLVQPNEASNSIAVIIQHLHGNMLSRWTNFLTEDGEKPGRRRDDEFEICTRTKEQLIQLWDEGWDTLQSSLRSLQEGDLARTITIRTQPLLVIDAINRQLSHYAQHVGQIVYLGRWIKGSGWTSLSIPKAGSQEFNERMKAERDQDGPTTSAEVTAPHKG